MNEFKLVSYVLIFLLCLYYWWQTIDRLSERPVDVFNTSIVFVVTGSATSLAYHWFPVANAIRNSGNFDSVLVYVFIFMIVALVATSHGFVTTSKAENQYNVIIGHMLAFGPALVWALLLLACLRITNNIYFEVFGTQKMINSSFGISLTIATVYFVGEYLGNLRNLEAKTAEVVTFFGGKRVGQSLKEGVNPLPGILPLFFQVGFYALFRFSIFWGAVRGFITTPITFAGTMVTYSYDGKAVVFNVSGIGKIVDETIVDDLMEDGAENPRRQLERLFAEYFQQGANAFIRTCQWQTLADGVGFGGRMVKSMAGSMRHLGLELKNVSIEWLGFQDQRQQQIFQEIAGRDLRQINQSMKAGEIERILRSGVSREDAERIWEAFMKDGRGSFKFGM